jgi:transposase
MAEMLLNELLGGAKVLADKAYDADWIRQLIAKQKCVAHIPPRSSRLKNIFYSKRLYKRRNLIERCINKLKQFRRIATRYDRLPENFLAMINLAAISLWMKIYESAA